MARARGIGALHSWAGGQVHELEQLAAIVDNSDDAIVSKNLNGIILSWNDAATRMYGYTAEEAIGRPIDIVIPDDEDKRAEELSIRASIARGERIRHYETIRRHKDGSVIEVSVSISPVRDAASGRIVGAAGFARDISELNRAYETKQHLAAIVDNSDDAIVSKNLEGIILSWNDAATRMYGYTAEEAIGRPIDIVIPDDEDKRAEELSIRASIARGERCPCPSHPCATPPAGSLRPRASPAISRNASSLRPTSTSRRSWTTPTTRSSP